MIFSGVNESGVSTSGILGIGYQAADAGIEDYPNFPDLVVNLDLTNRDAYSLYLNSFEATSGTLITLPIANQHDMSVKLNSISSGTETIAIYENYSLDTGTPYTFVNDPTFFFKAFHRSYSYKYENYAVDCNPPADKFFTFEFDKNAKIEVPYTAFSGPLYDKNNMILGHKFVRLGWSNSWSECLEKCLCCVR